MIFLWVCKSETVVLTISLEFLPISADGCMSHAGDVTCTQCFAQGYVLFDTLLPPYLLLVLAKEGESLVHSDHLLISIQAAESLVVLVHGRSLIANYIQQHPACIKMYQALLP